jgi:hypothetical protein
VCGEKGRERERERERERDRRNRRIGCTVPVYRVPLCYCVTPHTVTGRYETVGWRARFVLTVCQCERVDLLHTVADRPLVKGVDGGDRQDQCCSHPDKDVQEHCVGNVK